MNRSSFNFFFQIALIKKQDARKAYAGNNARKMRKNIGKGVGRNVNAASPVSIPLSTVAKTFMHL